MSKRSSTRPHTGVFQRRGSIYWWVEWRDLRGGKARASTGIPVAEDPDGLKAALIRAERIADQTRDRPAPARTFDDLMLLYLDQVSPLKRAAERDGYSAKALYPHLSGKRLDTITGADVRTYIAARQNAGIAPATINREIGLMSAATEWARRELEWPIINPWRQRRLTPPPGRNRWLTRDEADRLLAAADQPRYRYLPDFITIGLYAGLRPGEILALTWDRVDLARGEIRFTERDQKSGRLGAVPISTRAREALLNRARFRATHCPDTPWVFARSDGSQIKAVKRSFAAAVKAAGLEDVHPHDLRRTCGSWLVQAGVGIERVSRILRHSDISVTARIYAHLRPSDLADALDQIGGEGTAEGTIDCAGKKKPLVSG
jgi:integrase